jgi:putative flippase GtrA
VKRRFGRLALVGTLVTCLDLAVFAVAVRSGLPLALADAVALVIASGTSYSLHRWVTFADSPYVRWVHTPLAFVAIAGWAGIVDLTVLLLAAGPGGVDVGWAKVAGVIVAALVRGVAYRALLWRVVRSDHAQASCRPPSEGEVRLSVVIPAYSEADVIAASLDRVRRALAEIDRDGGVELIVVDDGSPDQTAARALEGGADVVERLAHNRGKGAAVRRGMELARGRTVAFIDADLAYSPDQLVTFASHIEQGWDVAVGSRKHDDTTTLVRARRLREIGGRVMNGLTLVVLLGQYRDTQCGIKAFRGDVAKVLAERGRLDRFAFDVELFHLTERYRLSLTEVPVRVENSTRSSVRVVRDAARMVVDLARIRRWAARGLYSPSGLPLPPARTDDTESTSEDADVST